MAEARQRRAARGGGLPRGYVASLLWPGRLPLPANDNRLPFRLAALLPLTATAALLAAAVWVVLS